MKRRLKSVLPPRVVTGVRRARRRIRRAWRQIIGTVEGADSRPRFEGSPRAYAAVKRALAAVHDGPEDVRYRALDLLEAHERSMAEALARRQLPRNGILLYARVASTLRKSQDAIRVLRELMHGQVEGRGVVALELATLLRRTGDLAEAADVLDVARADLGENARVARERRRLVKAQRRHEAAILAQGGLDPSSGNRTRSVANMIKAAELLGVDAASMPALERLVEAAVRLATGDSIEPSDAPATEPATHRTLFIAGFGWSGSGAIADALSDAPGVSFPFGNTEVTLLEGVPGITSGTRHLVDTCRVGNAAEASRVAARLVTVAGLGLALPSTSPSQSRRWQHKSLLWQCLTRDGDVARLLAGLQAFVDRVSTARSDTDGTLDATRYLLRDVLDAFPNRASVLVFNNVLHARNVDLAALFDRPRVLVVERDPRDQYVARARENLRKRIQPKAFIKSLRTSRERFESALHEPAVATAVERVRFEAFVLDATYRAEVLSRAVGVPPEAAPTGRFRPEVSRKNIGLHRSWEHQSEIVTIRDHFPDQVWEGEGEPLDAAIAAPQ